MVPPHFGVGGGHPLGSIVPPHFGAGFAAGFRILALINTSLKNSVVAMLVRGALPAKGIAWIWPADVTSRDTRTKERARFFICTTPF